MKVDTVQSSRSNELLRPDITEAEHVVVNCVPVDRGHQPRTINHEGRTQCCVVVLEEARNEPRSRNLPQSDSEEEAQTEPQPTSQW